MTENKQIVNFIKKHVRLSKQQKDLVTQKVFFLLWSLSVKKQGSLVIMGFCIPLFI